MTEKLQREVAEFGLRPLDDAHSTWSGAAIECEYALHAWFDAAGPDDAPRYAAYRAALDREEAAARELERLWDPTHGCRAVAGDRRGQVAGRRPAAPIVHEIPRRRS
jgi:hypothetical protein